MSVQLIETATLLGTEIQNLVRNYKKDSASRKNNVPYFQERLKRLLELWEDFEQHDEKIRDANDVPSTHEYFAYYSEIQNIVHQYNKEFQNQITTLNLSNVKSVQKSSQVEDTQSSTTASTVIENQCDDSASALKGLIRKFDVKMSALERLLNNTNAEHQSRQYARINKELIQQNWQQIESLYELIWEQCEHPTSIGMNLEKYLALESNAQKMIIELSIMCEESRDDSMNTSSMQSAIPLPKLTIPKFDGDYLKWTQFFDLFSHMVDKQQLPNVQKMYYLKSNLSGEADRLIKHLAVTEENYQSAWTLLQERYNNKRLLSATLVQKILNQPSCNGTASSIKGLHDTTQECLLALNNLGIETNTWDALLIQLLLKKLDRITHMRYEQAILHPRELQSVKDLLSFLETHFHSMEALGAKDKSAIQSGGRSCTSVIAQNKGSTACMYCKNGSHPLFSCKGFLSLATGDRLKFVQKHKLCINCMKSGHMTAQCASRNCTKCDKKHNTLLHLTAKSTANSTSSSNEEGTPATTLTTSVIKRGYVVLGTVRIKIASGYDTFVDCRAILDSGSQINLITEKLAKRLKLQVHMAPISIEGIGQRKKGCKGYIHTAVKSLATSFQTDIEAFVIQKIVSPQPIQNFDVSSWNIPATIKLADSDFNNPGEIDLLIGAEFYHNLLMEGRLQIGQNLPLLQNTVFGWMCCGRIDDLTQSPVTCGVFSENDETLDSMLTKFWELDTLQQSKPMLTEAERKCEEFFHQTTTRNDQGKFVVRLPFNNDNNCLGESLQMTTNRFYSLERRLLKQPKLKEMYVDFMHEYEQLGHMKKLHNSQLIKPYYTIPHHCVLKPDSTTTKLRVVFDASAKTSSGQSLNDIMYKGPVVQSELTSILLRFRKHRFVFTTDIEKMYRQILIHPDDQRFQIIVWRDNPNDQLEFYRLTTVTYGTRTAPYLATKCLQQIAHQNKNSLPFGSGALNNDFYVDDGLSGSDNLTEALTIKNELITMLSAAGFKLRKWCANTTRLLEGIPIQDQEVNLNLGDDASNGSVKTLGVMWLPKSDELCLKVNNTMSKSVTKRIVTSEVAQVYDPLGIVAPVIVKAKIFIQGLWQLKLDWDVGIPKQQEEEWLKFRHDLNVLNDVKVPRHVYNHKQPNRLQLHVFTDASERAYGAAVYIRSENKDGTTSVHLLCSKSRVAPLKTQTIPRLELCAALLGAELVTRVKEDLAYHHIIVHMWTDSEIVLHWINSEPALYQTFVSHRIAKIQELTPTQQWRHVRTKDNPADLVSRGLNPGDIKQSRIWWYGPLFLHGNEACWPSKFNKDLTTCNNIERKNCALGLVSTVEDDLVKLIYSIDHRGNFLRLQRITAYILRFIARLQSHEKNKQNLLSTMELNAAMVVISKAVQQSEFTNEIQQLLTSKELKSNNSLASLSPFMDSNNLIRVGGRLQEANLSFDAKHPILLPYNDPIVKLLMRHLHETNFHCGPQALLAQMRQRFWPIKGKLMARSTVQHCVRCTRSKPKTFNQIMGNLPQDRVQLERPFLNSGVDFCGPIWIHYKIRGKRPCKAYIAIFCCFATKAVHLELVADLTTDAFIGALNRFVSRRGRCQRIHCDNATNFVGAKNQLIELETCIQSKHATEKIHNFCSEKGIEFEFIPPRAPHFGGLWEAAVKSAKHLLVRGVGNVSLTYDELETVIVQIEGILNSRPIVPMSSNPNDLTALTPGHFLIGEPLTTHPSPDTSGTKKTLLQRWRLVQHLKEEFWGRWTNEYLNELQHRTKWKSQTTNVEPGTMVIIKEDNIPPLHWPLGRIVKTFNGPDNCVRVAEVKTKSGIIKRAIHRLAPLFPEDKSMPHAESTVPKAEKVSQAKTVDDSNQTPQKRPRLNTMVLTALAILFCLPIVLGSAVDITRFPNQPGIHFENIGKSHIITSHWTLLTYYDLGPFRQELEALSRGTAALNQMCQRLKNQACSDLVNQFTHVKNELATDSRLLLQRRTKRGAIDVVGNVANALFGVLDSEYANKMSQTIREIDNNEGHIVELIKNQTSIIDSTINIIKIDQEAVKRKFDAIDKSLSVLKNHIQTTTEDQRILESMFTVALHLMMTTSDLRRIHSVMLNVLTDVHHGQIGPFLLSADQLKAEIIKIKGHLSSSIQLPAQSEDLLSLYKLMTVEAGLTQDHVLFKITLPLIEAQEFNMYNIIPVPTLTNGSLYSVKPTTEVLAITAHGDKYYPLTRQQYSDCLKVGQQTVLCSYTQSIYNKGATENSCEVNLFNNETKLLCDVIKTPHNQWSQMTIRNQWLFSLKNPIKVTAVCGENVHQVLLEGSGILKINPECTIKNELFTLIGHQTFNSVFRPSITSHGNWSYLTNPKTSEPLLLESAIEPYNTELNELMMLQKMLKEQPFDHIFSNWQSTSYHFLGIGYTALILGVIIGTYIIITKIKRRTFNIQCNENIPMPAPRHDFSINV